MLHIDLRDRLIPDLFGFGASETPRTPLAITVEPLWIMIAFGMAMLIPGCSNLDVRRF